MKPLTDWNKENDSLKTQLNDKDRLLRQKEVYIMQMLDEFTKKKDVQQRLYDANIQTLKEKIHNQMKFIGKRLQNFTSNAWYRKTQYDKLSM